MTDDTTPNHATRDDAPAGAPSNDASHAPAAEKTPPTAGANPRYRRPLISAIEIENFKGIGAPVRIDLRPITLLFGQNSAGKSTVLHALCYAHELLTNGNADCHRTGPGGDRIDLGGFRQFVHRHDENREVRLRFELNLEGWRVPEDLEDDLLAERAQLDSAPTSQDLQGLSEHVHSGWVELRVGLRGDDPQITRYEVGVNDVVVGRIEAGAGRGRMLECSAGHPLLVNQGFRPAAEDGQPGVEPTAPAANTDHVRETPVTDWGNWRELTQVTGHALQSALPAWGRALAVPPTCVGAHRDVAEARFSALLVGIGQALRGALADLRYIGPLRELHPGSRRDAPAHRTADWVDGSAAWNCLANGADPRLLDDVNAWLSREDRLDTGHALQLRSVDHLIADGSARPPRRDFEFVAANGAISDTAPEVENRLRVRVPDVGAGVSQILPVLVATLDPRRPEITAIEQPLLHLHPRMEVEIGELFARCAPAAGMLLIETHSEHLLLRIMRRMRQTFDNDLPAGAPDLRPSDVNVLFVEVYPEQQRTLIREMPLNERGELVEAWPGGFFEEDLRELF